MRGLLERQLARTRALHALLLFSMARTGVTPCARAPHTRAPDACNPRACQIGGAPNSVPTRRVEPMNPKARRPG